MFKILVVGPSWIGDTLLAQPLFNLLKARHRELALDVLAPAWTLPLVNCMPEVRRGFASPFRHGELRLGARRQLAHELRGEGYDQAIVLPNTFKSVLAPFFAGIPRRTGYRGEMRWGLVNDVRRLDPRASPMLAERYAALAGDAGESVPRPLPAVRLRVDEASRGATLSRLGLAASQPAVALCPARSTARPALPVENLPCSPRTVRRPPDMVAVGPDASLLEASCAPRDRTHQSCGPRRFREVIEGWPRHASW